MHDRRGGWIVGDFSSATFDSPYREKERSTTKKQEAQRKDFFYSFFMVSFVMQVLARSLLQPSLAPDYHVSTILLLRDCDMRRNDTVSTGWHLSWEITFDIADVQRLTFSRWRWIWSWLRITVAIVAVTVSTLMFSASVHWLLLAVVDAVFAAASEFAAFVGFETFAALRSAASLTTTARGQRGQKVLLRLNAICANLADSDFPRPCCLHSSHCHWQVHRH